MMKRLLAATLLTISFGLVSPTHLAAQPGTPPGGSPAQSGGNAISIGAQSYAKHCAVCHGEQREGNLPGFPPLLDVNRKLTAQQIASLIHTGKGRMPAFSTLPQAELSSLLRFLATDDLPTQAHASNGSTEIAAAGQHLFQRNCAFCHGRDAAGGETGPDLTRSKLVLADVGGNKISEVIHNGRPEKKMPAFNFSNEEVHSLVVFIHGQQAAAATRPGGRRGVDVSDLQTGNVADGKAYFNGAGTCGRCHSATGDLASIATRYQGLQLERQMLYPQEPHSRVAASLPSGQKFTGSLVYNDEFTIGLRDSNGVYHSWPVNRIHYTIDSPVEAHVQLFSRYSDTDIHNLMAYLQTLR